MPKLVLRFEDRVVKHCVVGTSASIGRLPDNTVVIDNAAVSGHHAYVCRDGDHFVVEDLASTNGTFVNEKRVRRHALQNGDEVRIGKHTLVFEQTVGDDAGDHDRVERIMTNPGDTVFLEADQYKSLLAMLKETEARVTNGAASQAAASGVGILRVIAGSADQPEYRLEARTSLVGKSETALVRLRGWLKPKEAVAIARTADGYTATVLGGRTRINNARLSGRHKLEDGDILEVSGLKLQFRAGADTSVEQTLERRGAQPTEAE